MSRVDTAEVAFKEFPPNADGGPDANQTVPVIFRPALRPQLTAGTRQRRSSHRRARPAAGRDRRARGADRRRSPGPGLDRAAPPGGLTGTSGAGRLGHTLLLSRPGSRIAVLGGESDAHPDPAGDRP